MVFALFFVFSEGFFCVELCKRERGALSFFFFLESKKKKKTVGKKTSFFSTRSLFLFRFFSLGEENKRKRKTKTMAFALSPSVAARRVRLSSSRQVRCELFNLLEAAVLPIRKKLLF